MDWQEKVLDRGGHDSARRLAEAAGAEFYLAGGTALALRFGHRISLDLDLFSAGCRLAQADRLGLKEKLELSGPLGILEEKDGTCHLRLNKTPASLFYYPYKLLFLPAVWNGLKVASVEDIAAMKLSAVVSRGSKKDFIDLFYIFRLFKVADIFGWAERKFSDHPDFTMQAAKALVYFDDAEKEPAPRLLKPAPWREIKTYFEKEIPRYLKFR